MDFTGNEKSSQIVYETSAYNKKVGTKLFLISLKKY